MTQVACGWHHTILVSDSNKLFTFGWSKYSQLGHGDFQDHLIPHQVKALEKLKFNLHNFGHLKSKSKTPKSKCTISKFTIPKSKFQILQFQNQNSQISFSCH
jgi:hypothetical protein